MLMNFDPSCDRIPIAPENNAPTRQDVMAQLSHLLATANPAEQIDSAQYIHRISDAAQRSSPEQASRIAVHYDLTDALSLDAPRMTALGLFVGEALMNTFRHAHPSGVTGEVRITCRRFGEQVMVAIEDDGVGLPVGFNTAKDGRVGYQVIRDLAGRLKARLSHQSTPLGLKVEVLFPL